MRFDPTITLTALLAFGSALMTLLLFIGRYVSRRHIEMLNRIESSLAKTAAALARVEERYVRLDVRVAVVETTVGEIARRVRRVEEKVDLALQRR